MRCIKCQRTLNQGVKICPKCFTTITVTEAVSGRGRLKPRSKVSLKGVASRMSGTYHVPATSHRIAESDKFDSSLKVRCIKCGTVNDKGTRNCIRCGSRIT
ncbi:MAG: zinc ribbon domain-containing protein [Candidatus Thorarchaeota archaeon]